MQALVNVMLDGGESPSNVITRCTYSPSLFRLKRGKGVRLRLLWIFPKDVNVIPNKAWSDNFASQGVVSRYGECADSVENVDNIMWSGDDHVRVEDHV